MKSMLLSAVALVGLAFAVGCTTETTDGSGGGGGEGGGSGGGGTTTSANVTTTTTGSGGGTTAPACYFEDAALLAPGDETLVGQGLCDSTQVAGLWTACFDDAATTETCTAFDTANGECTDCIFGTQDGPTPPLLATDTSVYLNVLACQSAAMNLPQCGPQTSQIIFCAQTACSECDDAGYDACVDWAFSDNGICSQLPLDTACEAVLAVESLDARCTGANFEEGYTNISNYMCGPATGG